jgi:pSer/pThr/pTyr-binding forkhead associated (FHA) protein
MLELDLVVLPATDQEYDLLTSHIPVSHFPFIIGRSPACDYPIDDPMISRHHCAFSVRGGRVWVGDLGSRNGTRLNGKRLARPQPLSRGDVLAVGALTYVVRLHEAPMAVQATIHSNAEPHAPAS